LAREKNKISVEVFPELFFPKKIFAVNDSRGSSKLVIVREFRKELSFCLDGT